MQWVVTVKLSNQIQNFSIKKNSTVLDENRRSNQECSDTFIKENKFDRTDLLFRCANQKVCYTSYLKVNRFNCVHSTVTLWEFTQCNNNSVFRSYATIPWTRVRCWRLMSADFCQQYLLWMRICPRSNQRLAQNSFPQAECQPKTALLQEAQTHAQSKTKKHKGILGATFQPICNRELNILLNGKPSGPTRTFVGTTTPEQSPSILCPLRKVAVEIANKNNELSAPSTVSMGQTHV